MAAFPAKRKHLLYLELEKLVEAGFGIRQAADLLMETKSKGVEGRLLGDLQKGLDQGTGIAGAFASGGLTSMELAIIEAGEKSGKLGSAFGHLADYFELMAKNRQRALKAMIYPFILLHFGLLLSVIPTNLMEEGITVAGTLTRFVVVLIGTYVLIGVGTVTVLWLLKRAPQSVAIDRLLNAIPVVGKARRNLAMARFTRVYHAALVAGIPMKEVVAMAAEASSSGSLRAASESLLAGVDRGQALGPVFVREPAFPASFSKSYLTAEESGMLDRDLERWSKLFEEDAASGVRSLSVVLPKIGYALIVLFVVWKLVDFYAGYYGSLKEIGI